MLNKIEDLHKYILFSWILILTKICYIGTLLKILSRIDLGISSVNESNQYR